MTWLNLLLFLFASSGFCAAKQVIVNTSKGLIVGHPGTDGNYSTFFGIPYALVDEENPFGMSLPYPHFKGPFFASDPDIICHQSMTLLSGGTLQCLRLNIYVPNAANINNTVPILVWFHGDYSIFGGANRYRSEYLVQHDIIVVTVNYRQGPYGFLCLDDPTVPGNQGLKDQISALRWIKQNIRAFGGDANKVTIAGQGYGGGWIDLHLYSMYEKLFDKAIVQSGSMYAAGLFTNADHDAAIKLANYLGNNTQNTKHALKFLATADPAELMKAASKLDLRLRPCKENTFKGKNVSHFMTYDPFHVQPSHKLKDNSILIGYNSNEDFIILAILALSAGDNSQLQLDNIITDLINKTFVLNRHELEALSGIVKKFYFDNKANVKESLLKLSNVTSDWMYNYPVEWSVNNYVKHGAAKVYKYMFSYIAQSVVKNLSGAGASDTTELPYLFDWGTPMDTDEEILMRNRMTKMWTNFVKFGDPTPEQSDLLPVQWVPVANASRPYLNIDLKMEMREDAYRQRMAFWELIWHNYWRNSFIIKKRPIKQD